MRTWIVLPLSFVARSLRCSSRRPRPRKKARMRPAPAVRASTSSPSPPLVALVASCAALHAAAGELLEREGLDLHAETARRRAQADQVTAMHLLAEDRVAKGATPLELTAYTAEVEQLTAAARDRMTAIVTHAEPGLFEREEQVCSSLIPLEDEVLAKLTADFGPAPGAFAAFDQSSSSTTISTR